MERSFRVSRRSFVSAAALWPAARKLWAQDPAPTFTTGVKVVSLLATVRDKKGTVVRNLTKDDFLLDEDGRPQTIRYFSQESDLPLTVGLLVDTSGSTRRVLPDERRASRQFLEQVLRQDRDRAFVIRFDREVELLQDLTSSREKLEKGLDLLESDSGRGFSRRGWPPSGRGGGRRGGGMGGGTSLYDSVLLASDELMKKESGRKALILLTDGMDAGSKVSLSEAVEAAQRADCIVFSILFEDPDMVFGGFGMGRRGGMEPVDGKKILQRISRETGARFFEVSKKQPIEKVFAAIEEDLRNQYSLGYSSDRSDATYRRIHLTTRQKGLVVQTREGYYPS